MTFKMHLLTELINDLLTKENKEEEIFINVHSSFVSEFQPFFLPLKKIPNFLESFFSLSFTVFLWILEINRRKRSQFRLRCVGERCACSFIQGRYIEI